jgi:hypothetical protein
LLRRFNFVRPFTDGAKEQGIKFFGGEIREWKTGFRGEGVVDDGKVFGVLLMIVAVVAVNS